MPIRLQCENCGAELEAPDSAAGKTRPCPNCGEPIVVPAQPDAASSPPVEQPAEAPPPTAEPDVPEADAQQQPQDEQGDGLGKFYGGDTGTSPLRWILALIFFVIGAVFCVFIIARSGGEHGGIIPPVRLGNIEKFTEKTHELYTKALTATREGETKQAIRLYRKVLDRLERLPTATATTFGIEQVREEYEALKAGGAQQQPQPESGADEAAPSPDGAQQQ